MRITFSRQMDVQTVTDIKGLLLPSWWKRPWSQELADKIFKWRFLDVPDGEALLAYDGDRCIAMVASYTRPYVSGNRTLAVRECYDWFCLPEYRHSGVGVVLLRKLMNEPEPILTIGGTNDARTLLRILGWKRLPDLSDYTLPLTANWLVNKMRGLLRLPLPSNRWENPFRLPWPRLWLERSRAPGCSVVNPLQELSTIVPAGSAYELLPLVRKLEVRWLYQAPECMGKFFGLLFSENTKPMGFSLGRIHFDGRLNRALLIHVQASSPSVELYAAMLAQTIVHARDQGADIADCRASCPLMRAALSSLGFRESAIIPSYWWSKGVDLPTGTIHLMSLHADLPFLTGDV